MTFLSYYGILILDIYIFERNSVKMKKFARLSSAIALLLAIITLFSGCSIAELTRQALNKGDSSISADINNTDSTAITGSSDSSGTNSVVLVDKSTETSTPAYSSSNTSSNADKTNGTTTHTKSPSVQKPSHTVNNTVTTTKKDYGTGVTETPVKDIQDYLWDSTNPNDAQKILDIAGFEYDDKQGIYYSQMNPLQRKFGFNFVYDTAAPIAGMVYDTERLEFVYDNKEWMIQLWKGQYGITSGGEVGLYSRDPKKVMQYDCADDEELIVMQYDFYNMGKKVFSRGPEKHWWLTGFKVFNIGIPFMITMDITLKFTDNQMASQFLKALKKSQTSANALLNPINYKRNGSTIRFVWGSVPEGIKVKNGQIV